MRDGHECVVYDVNEAAIAQLESEGAIGARTLAEFAAKLTTPRAALDHGARGDLRRRPSTELAAAARARRHHHRRRQQLLPRRHRPRASGSQPNGIHYVDVGTSGGVFGLERGYCLMIGGEDEIVARLDPIFRTLAPGVDSAPPHARAHRRPRRPPSTASSTAAGTAPGTS